MDGRKMKRGQEKQRMGRKEEGRKKGREIEKKWKNKEGRTEGRKG